MKISVYVLGVSRVYTLPDLPSQSRKHREFPEISVKNADWRTFLVIQWLGLCASTAGCLGLILQARCKAEKKKKKPADSNPSDPKLPHFDPTQHTVPFSKMVYKSEIGLISSFQHVTDHYILQSSVAGHWFIFTLNLRKSTPFKS